jgi:hypothetical protein
MSVPNPATTEWVPLQGTRLDGMTYWGTYEASRTYNDGDCAIGPDGILYMCVKDGTVGTTPSTWPGQSASQGSKGDTGAQGIPGVGVPMPVVNGQWIKGVGGIAIWSPIIETDVRGLTVADTTWHVVGRGGGEPGYENGWIDYQDPPFPPARFRKDAAGVVHLSGLVKNGTLGTSIFTLPVGYRPAAGKTLHCITVANATAAYIHINNTSHGAIQGNTSNAWLSLDPISFLAEA